MDDRLRRFAKGSPNFGALYQHQPLLSLYGASAEATVFTAAKNILAAGRAVARGDSGDACGADVSRQGSSLPQSAMKQEAPRSDPGPARGGRS
jgi:hypothetical protein